MNRQPVRRALLGRSPAWSSWRGLRFAAWVVGLAFVVGLHVDLLAERIVSQTFLTPEVALRWFLSGLLLGALALLRWRGISLVRGRPALVIWTLVLLLHAMALLPAVENLAQDLGEAARYGFLGLLPAVVALGPIALLLALFTLFGAPAGTRKPSPRPLFALDVLRQPALAAGFGNAVGCRPPPVATIRSSAV